MIPARTEFWLATGGAGIAGTVGYAYADPRLLLTGVTRGLETEGARTQSNLA